MASSLNIAIPSIGREFSVSPTVLSWVVTAYILATATCLLPAGRIADIKAANDKAEREKAELVRQYEEKERIVKAKKEAAEEAERKRQEDVQHRTAVNNNILRSLMAYGCDEETGTAIVKAMIAGSVPHVSVNY